MRCVIEINSAKGETEEGHRRRTGKGGGGVMVDHLNYPLKYTKHKGKNIKNILNETVEPIPAISQSKIDVEKQHFLGWGLYGTVR